MDLPFLHMTLLEFVQAVGYIGVFLIVFVESGIPFGVVIPLPGDTLLFTAGLLAASGAVAVVPLMLTVAIAAFLGGLAGYWSGTIFGPRLFKNEKAWFMNPRTLRRAEQFFEKYGARALILARFLPILRTVAPVGAGIARMRVSQFVRYNFIGAVLWTLVVTLLGYFLGRVVPNAEHYLLPAVIIIVLISIAGALRETLQAKKEAATRPE